MFRYTLRMKVADLTKEQRKELVAWADAGFREYADLCGYWEGEIRNNIRAQIDKYAEEFSRVLRDEVEMSDEDDPQALRTDLYGLMKSGCPASGLVELMLASTSDFGVTISDLLVRAEVLDDNLISHKNLGFPTEPRRAVKIRGLRTIPRSRRGVKRGVPLSIQFMLEIMEKKGPPYTYCDGVTRAARSVRPLAYFYLLLKHFGHGHDTLTYLLRTMQYVRRRVPSVADYLKTRGRDTFRAGALQRRVLRFFKSHPASESVMRKDVRDYLSGKGGERRKTLLSTY